MAAHLNYKLVNSAVTSLFQYEEKKKGADGKISLVDAYARPLIVQVLSPLLKPLLHSKAIYTDTHLFICIYIFLPNDVLSHTRFN